MSVVLRGYRDDDLPMAIAIETDPGVMAELGGPRPVVDIEAVHRRRLQERWWLVIADGETGEALGTLGVWDSEHDGAPIHETGWTLLPAAQGRGVATAALRELIRRVTADADADAIERLHAFPGTTNGASNRLCEKLGFEPRGTTEVDFAGRTLHCNVWVLELAPRT